MKLVEPSTLSGNLTDKSVLVTFSFLPDKLRDKDLKRINITVNGSAANGNAIDAGTVDLPVVRAPFPQTLPVPLLRNAYCRASTISEATHSCTRARARTRHPKRTRAHGMRARAHPPLGGMPGSLHVPRCPAATLVRRGAARRGAEAVSPSDA